MTHQRSFTPSKDFKQVPWKVLCEDDEGFRTKITVTASGPNDAKNRIRAEYVDLTPLQAKRA